MCRPLSQQVVAQHCTTARLASWHLPTAVRQVLAACSGPAGPAAALTQASFRASASGCMQPPSLACLGRPFGRLPPCCPWSQQAVQQRTRTPHTLERSVAGWRLLAGAERPVACSLSRCCSCCSPRAPVRCDRIACLQAQAIPCPPCRPSSRSCCCWPSQTWATCGSGRCPCPHSPRCCPCSWLPWAAPRVRTGPTWRCWRN